MARSQESFNKKEVKNKKDKKRKDKAAKMTARKEEGKSGFEDMIAYVDEFGHITSAPPDPTAKKIEINSEDIEIGVPKREDEVMDRTRTGVVTHYNDSKGYGFIKDSGTGESLFVHANDLLEQIGMNSKVTFEIGKGQRGPVALQVRLYKAEPKSDLKEESKAEPEAEPKAEPETESNEEPKEE